MEVTHELSEIGGSVNITPVVGTENLVILERITMGWTLEGEGMTTGL